VNRTGTIAVVGILLIVVASAGVALWKWLPPHFQVKKTPEKKDTSVAGIIEPTAGKPALQVPGLKVVYQDLGSQIALDLEAAGMPIVYTQGSSSPQSPSQRGRSYAVYPNGATCIQFIAADQVIRCGEAASGAKVQVNGSLKARKVSWIIPKQELTSSSEEVYVAFQIFDEVDQRSIYVPDSTLRSMYRLHFLPKVNAEQAQPSQLPPLEPTPAAPEPAAAGKLPAETVARPAPDPVIVSFQAEPDQIDKGATTVLLWKVTGSSQVKIEPGIGLVSSQGTRTVSPLKTTEYELKAIADIGVIARRVKVIVNAARPPSIVNFRAEPSNLDKGGGSTLRWSVTGAAKIRIDPGLNGLPAQGEALVSPEQSTVYTLVAEGGEGQASAQLIVHVAAPQQPIIFFEAVPATMTQGQNSELRWSTQNADHVMIEPTVGVKSTNGSVYVAPDRTTRYTLTATGPGGSATKDTLVSVSPPGPSAGEIVWTGNVHGVQLVTIDRDQVDMGTLQGALPGQPCIIQPMDEHHVSVASTPGPRNNYQRLVLRVTGNGSVRVVVKWALQ
jgi:hypothetical protein